jgi:hypothetical protein
MSASGLRDLMKRIESDPDFAALMKSDAPAAVAKYELSTVELFALSCADGDALSRLLESSSKELRSELSIFEKAFLPAFDEKAQARYLEVETSNGGTNTGKTSKVTSSGVTKCCWP